MDEKRLTFASQPRSRGLNISDLTRSDVAPSPLNRKIEKKAGEIGDDDSVFSRRALLSPSPKFAEAIGPENIDNSAFQDLDYLQAEDLAGNLKKLIRQSTAQDLLEFAGQGLEAEKVDSLLKIKE